MALPLEFGETRALSTLQQYDIITFSSEQVREDIFMVFSLEVDYGIKAALLQLWRFQGGYDHAFFNVIESDLGLNKQVPYHTPQIQEASITSITSYRSPTTHLSQKEEFFFDVWPETTTKEPDDQHNLPFKVLVELEGEELEIVVPSWTPLQRLPLDRLAEGSLAELWQVNGHYSMMKVLQL